MTDTIHLGLPLIEAAQAQKHVTHNEALARLDTIVQLNVQSRALAAPPSASAEGDRYIVKATGTGGFSGKDNQVALYSGGGWLFYPPHTGWLAYVADEGVLVAWDGAAWSSAASSSGDISSLQNLTLLGVGTAADSTNPFSAKLNNALWVSKTTGEGGDGNLRYKLSKESAAKTLSVLFQDNFSGRAEIGLTGDDDFHFKVSADGSSWIDAIIIDKSTGSAKLNAGFFLTGDLAPSQITADQNDYNPTGLSSTSVLRLSTDASRNITGLSGGGDGRIVAIVNAGTHDIVLKDASASSSAANRFAFGADTTLIAKQSAILWYDATDTRWKLLAASQSGGGSGSAPDFSVITGTAAISQGGTGATTASGARTNLGLGTAATLDVGTAANKIVQLDSSARLPAVDGSQLTNLPGGGSPPADLDLLLAELALGLADALNVAQFLGSAGNRFADSFDATTYVDVAGATNLDTGTAGVLKPTNSSGQVSQGAGTAIGTLTATGGLAASFDGTTNQAGSASSMLVAGASGMTSTWIGKDWGSGTTRIVNRVKIWASNDNPFRGDNAAITWHLRGSSDGTNWTVLFSGTAPTGNGATIDQTSGIDISTAYRYHSVAFQANGSNGILIAEVQFFETGSANNLTVKSTALTAAAVPTSAKIVARTKNVDSITLNTDLILSVSRDGGTTFTNATMNDRFTANSFHALESDAIDVTGQPSGSSVKWKAVTANNKMLELHDVYLYWT